MLPAVDASIWSRGALLLEVAIWARRRPVLVKRLAVLDGGEAMDRRFLRWTPVHVRADGRR